MHLKAPASLFGLAVSLVIGVVYGGSCYGTGCCTLGTNPKQAMIAGFCWLTLGIVL